MRVKFAPIVSPQHGKISALLLGIERTIFKASGVSSHQMSFPKNEGKRAKMELACEMQ
jgi:hypothetical protein